MVTELGKLAFSQCCTMFTCRLRHAWIYICTMCRYIVQCQDYDTALCLKSEFWVLKILTKKGTPKLYKLKKRPPLWERSNYKTDLSWLEVLSKIVTSPYSEICIYCTGNIWCHGNCWIISGCPGDGVEVKVRCRPCLHG